ncbi:MAG: sulfatase-like hydrolase/transferase [Reichenbachiella sp.]
MKRNYCIDLRSVIGLALMFILGLRASAQSPNILFIYADDQAFDAINALGNEELITPNLDKLVEQGVSFSNAYNMGSWTGAVCLASRTMLNTGLSLWHAKSAEGHLDERVAKDMLWSNLMSTAGYETYFTGKWHVHSDITKSFDHIGTVRSGMPNQTEIGYDRPLHEYDSIWRPWDESQGGYWKGGTHWSEVVAKEAIGFLEEAAKRETPFMMYVAFNAPHDPRQSPKEFVDKYPLNEISLPASFQSEHSNKQEMGCFMIEKNGKTIFQRDEHLAPHPRSALAVKTNRQEYYAIITHLDHQVGRIIAALKASGQYNNTYIVFTADHGLAVGNHGLMGKQNLYEHSAKAPLIISGPGIRANQRKDQLVYLQDMMASILDLCGVDIPTYVEFKSLKPIIKSYANDSIRTSIYGAYLDLQRMVRKGNVKMILYPDVPIAELYDLASDPFETIDLSTDPAYINVKDELFDELLSLQLQFGDHLKLNKEDYW